VSSRVCRRSHSTVPCFYVHAGLRIGDFWSSDDATFPGKASKLSMVESESTLPDASARVHTGMITCTCSLLAPSSKIITMKFQTCNRDYCIIQVAQSNLDHVLN